MLGASPLPPALAAPGSCDMRPPPPPHHIAVGGDSTHYRNGAPMPGVPAPPLAARIFLVCGPNPMLRASTMGLGFRTGSGPRVSGWVPWTVLWRGYGTRKPPPPPLHVAGAHLEVHWRAVPLAF